jgi:MFS family permease
LKRAALYAGGYLGPFGGGVIAVLIPELRDAYHATTAQVTAGITAYLVPFAAFQVVSGTIGGRVGIGRTIRIAYVAYAIASVAVALTTSESAFLVARGLQGAANAFTTPLLLATLAEATADAELGRTMGTFAAVQTAGIVSAPLVGGLAAEVDYRLAFLAPAAVALLLAVGPLPRAATRDRAEPPRLRAALTPRTWWTSAAAFMAFFAIPGVSFLVALRAGDAFGLGPTSRGLLLAGFGAAGVIAGRPAGALVDRLGPVRVSSTGAVLAACVIPLLGLVEAPAPLAAAWIVAGLGSALVWAGLNTLTVQAAPANRAGAVSLVGAFKFSGNAITPLILLPIYHARSWLAFAGAGALSTSIAYLSVRAGGGRAVAAERSACLPRTQGAACAGRTGKPEDAGRRA